MMINSEGGKSEIEEVEILEELKGAVIKKITKRKGGTFGCGEDIIFERWAEINSPKLG